MARTMMVRVPWETVGVIEVDGGVAAFADAARVKEAVKAFKEALPEFRPASRLGQVATEFPPVGAPGEVLPMVVVGTGGDMPLPEVDELWEKLSEGGEEGPCGWLKDRYGLSWQIVPTVLGEMLRDKDPKKAERVMTAMLQMKKIDIPTLQQAYGQG